MEQEVLELIEKVHKLFKEKGFTLSVAESCTGGLICHYLTTLPGASTFFVAGVISYTEKAKTDILGIPADMIMRFGVISEGISREMAEKVRLLTKTDCALSTTGNLGPDLLEGKEKGLVYVAASKNGKTISRKMKLTGDRRENKVEASLSALRLLIELVE